MGRRDCEKTRDICRIKRKVEVVNGTTNTWDYTYDLAGRLQTVQLNGAAYESYTYDGNGNRLTVVKPSDSTTATYDAQDRLLTYGPWTYVQGLDEPAIVERALESLEQSLGVLDEEEFTVTADAARVVDEGDELALHLAHPVLHIGAKHRVGLPELVGMRFGEGEPAFAFDLGVGLEQLVRLDDATESVRRDPLALQEAFLARRKTRGVLRTLLRATPAMRRGGAAREHAAWHCAPPAHAVRLGRR